MSSSPRCQPQVQVTVTVVDGRVHPVVKSCMGPGATDLVSVWPRSSEIVNIPAPVVNTRTLMSVLGPGENVKLLVVVVGASKKIWFVGSTSYAVSQRH